MYGRHKCHSLQFGTTWKQNSYTHKETPKKIQLSFRAGTTGIVSEGE